MSALDKLQAQIGVLTIKNITYGGKVYSSIRSFNVLKDVLSKHFGNFRYASFHGIKNGTISKSGKIIMFVMTTSKM